ncbi:MAG: YrhK family protein [Psychrobacter sp.]|nr:YrhK family protein [Psychrobacter sp.]
MAKGQVMSKNRKWGMDIGQRHIIIQRRYEALGALNDLLIAIWFLIGSFFFLNESLTQDGTWLFIVGSAQLIIKPLIKLMSLVHVKKAFNKLNQHNDYDQ